MWSFALESGFRQAEGAAVGTDFQQRDFYHTEDRYANDHADDTVELAADDDGEEDQQWVEIGDPGDKDRNQDEIVDQYLGNQDVENHDPPELAAGSEVNKGDQNPWDHADNRAYVGDQIGDSGKNAEY